MANQDGEDGQEEMEVIVQMLEVQMSIEIQISKRVLEGETMKDLQAELSQQVSELELAELPLLFYGLLLA